MGEQTSEREIFDISGPTHLNSIDWSILEQRTSVVASLVQGVYILERDRQEKREGHKALAPIWWGVFHFQCIKILVDKDCLTFGAIFEYKPPTHKYYPIPPQHLCPRYVVAFRGTITKPVSRKRDCYLNGLLALNGLTRNTRYQVSSQAVKELIAQVGPTNVWLAGHSLGAAISLQVGKEMAMRGIHIETYLFNPPYLSAPVEILKNETLKTGMRIVGSIATAGLSLLTKGSRNKNPDHDPFKILRTWIPYLFVNPHDPISCEYVGYFNHREKKMEGWGIGKIERIATEDSIVGLISGALGRDGEAPHLIPSAFVTKNMISIHQDLKLSHGIHQWWTANPSWHSNLYQMR